MTTTHSTWWWDTLCCITFRMSSCRCGKCCGSVYEPSAAALIVLLLPRLPSRISVSPCEATVFSMVKAVWWLDPSTRVTPTSVMLPLESGTSATAVNVLSPELPRMSNTFVPLWGVTVSTGTVTGGSPALPSEMFCVAPVSVIDSPPSSVTLVAISKTFDAASIEPVIAAGQRVFGENRVQEAKAKWPPLLDRHGGLELHLVGALQSNKAKDAVALFDAIHSVDRASLSFSAFAEGRGGTFGYTERRYCRTWLRECFAVLDTVAAVLK